MAPAVRDQVATTSCLVGLGRRHFRLRGVRLLCAVATASGLIGYDVTGTVPGYFWTKDAQRPVVGWRINPAYGSIPQMVLITNGPHTTVTETDRWDDQCPALDAGGRCTVAGTARCVDGPATIRG